MGHTCLSCGEKIITEREREREREIFKEPSMAMVKLKLSRYSPSISFRAFCTLRTQLSQQRNTSISMTCILPDPQKTRDSAQIPQMGFKIC